MEVRHEFHDDPVRAALSVTERSQPQLCGTLWLTHEHDTRDFVLSAGDVYTIDRGGLTPVEAQSSASVCVMSHYVEETRVPHFGRTFAARLRNWAESVGAAAMARRWVPYV